MAQECNNQEAREAYSTKGNSFKVPVTSVTIIAKIIKTLINLPNLPKPPIPKQIIAIGNTFRPGINSASMTAKLLQKKSQYGMPTSPLPSGGENLDNIKDNLIMETITEELLTKANIKITIPPGAMKIFNVDGSTGTNIDIISGEGILT
jgi:hypothetical protein